MRHPHYLKATTTSEMPHEAIWVDTETKGIKQLDGSERHTLKFGYAAYSRTSRAGKWIAPQWIKFTTLEQFWEWAISRLHGKSKLYIFAHNWAFDAPVLDTFNVLPQEGFKLIGSVIQSPPVILRWRRAPHTIVMLDTLNIWRMPLKKLGESIGLPKLKMPPETASQDDWDTYARRDVEIIMQACFKWWRFLSDNDLGGFAPTLASQAMRTFKHKFMKHQILIDDNEKALALARDSLHGGRTECFYIGTVPTRIYKTDINSQYPYVMATKEMPTKLIGHYRRIDIHDLSHWINDYCVTAKVIIETDLPVFPVVFDDRLIFPTGRFVATLSTPEIRYALDHMLIRKVFAVNVYEKAILFKDYVDYFYAYRNQCRDLGNDADAHNAKILLNSLFGKWAQRGMIYQKEYDTDDLTIQHWTEVDAETMEATHYRQYAGIVESLSREPESRDSHPAIAAHITAHARDLVWGLMRVCGFGHCYYCDTDSLWVDETGYRRLSEHMDDKELGKLKLEGVHDNVTLFGAKDYIVDGKARIKGVRKNAVQLSENKFVQAKFSSLVGLLRQGDMSAPIVRQQPKTLSRIYYKGDVGADGKVSPFILNTGA